MAQYKNNISMTITSKFLEFVTFPIYIALILECQTQMKASRGFMNNENVEFVSPFNSDVETCIHPLVESGIVDWVRIEVAIFYGRLAAMIFFAFSYITFQHKKTKVFLNSDDLKLAESIVQHENYKVSIIDDDDDNFVDAF